jgi:acyl carrier protein
VIDIADGVREVIEHHLGAAKTGMTEDARLTDLGADSIDLYEVVMSLEEKFNINIDDRDAQRLTTIGDTIAFIKGRLS